jgi:hypothetical protein
VSDKAALFARGTRLLADFTRANNLELPAIRPGDASRWNVNACAYYRPTYIAICIERCASIGTAGQAWSYPGWAVDRTPYGVLAHELGHHADVTRGNVRSAYSSEFSAQLRGAAGEDRLTNYCPNDAEWFAEMFRLFVTNPGLLQALRPRTYRELTAAKFVPALPLDWRALLAKAPPRTRQLAERRVEEARGRLL